MNTMRISLIFKLIVLLIVILIVSPLTLYAQIEKDNNVTTTNEANEFISIKENPYSFNNPNGKVWNYNDDNTINFLKLPDQTQSNFTNKYFNNQTGYWLSGYTATNQSFPLVYLDEKKLFLNRRFGRQVLVSVGTSVEDYDFLRGRRYKNANFLFRLHGITPFLCNSIKYPLLFIVFSI